MLNIDGIYSTNTRGGVRGQGDENGNSFSAFIAYGNRLLAKVYNISGDDANGSIIYINKNGRYRKYTVYGYYNDSALTGFILGVLYNGERESDQPGNIPDVPVQVQVGANA